MARKLRSNAEYGNARWATRRALWRALGLTDADFDKPKIAVVNSSSDLAICYSHLDGIAKRMKTTEAFENAVMVMLCVSGSINSAKHLAAVAQEASCDIDVYKLFEKYADVIPLLTAVRPNGDSTTEAFEAAGGTQGVMKQLQQFMKTGARTVTGRTLAENLASFKVLDEETIRPVTRPLGKHPTIVMLRGSLSPETSIVKLSVTEQRNLQLRGPAVVFENALDAINGIQDGKVSAGQVVVVRGLGPKGTPGMGVASAVVFAVLGAGLAGKVAVVTDGQLSGLTNVGITVAEVAPEAAAGGPIGLVENGDIIAIDVEKRTADLEVTVAELAKRRKNLTRWDKTDERGWLAMYRELVEGVGKGRILRR